MGEMFESEVWRLEFFHGEHLVFTVHDNSGCPNVGEFVTLPTVGRVVVRSIDHIYLADMYLVRCQVEPANSQN